MSEEENIETKRWLFMCNSIFKSRGFSATDELHVSVATQTKTGDPFSGIVAVISTFTFTFIPHVKCLNSTLT